jgi:hypothetical protein
MADSKEARTYGPQPSLDPKADPNSEEFVNPFLSSNATLGLPEAGPANRPDGWTDEDEQHARQAAQADAAEPDENYHG